MTALKDSLGSPISIDKMYIDSTFFSHVYPHFPDQFRSAKRICDVIEEWLGQSTKHVVSLKMPARYGYEFLFKEIAKRTNRKIHINNDEMIKYRYIPELDNIFTTLSRTSQIHACFDYNNKNGKYLTCNPDIDPAMVRVIKPTAMIWTDWTKNTDLVKKEPNEHFRVCYSNHSSYMEIRDFLEYLHPKDVELNVIPTDAVRKKQMMDELAEIMKPKSSSKCANSIPQSNWDLLSKVIQINSSTKCCPLRSATKEQLTMCPPKRKKI